MALQKPEIDNVTTEATQTTTEPAKIESGMNATDLDIENSFAVGSLLNNFLEPKKEKTADQLETTEEDNEKKEETPQIDVDKLLSEDANFKRMEELKTLGYTEEHALEAVFGKQEETKETSEEDFTIPELNPKTVELYNDVYKNLSNDQIQYFVQACQQGTDQQLLEFIKAYPQQIGMTAEQVKDLTELPIYENDPVATATVKTNIKAIMQNFYGYHLKNISDINNYATQRQKVTETFTTKANTMLLENFPAMLNSSKEPNMASKHEAVYKTWETFFNTKLKVLDQSSQDDPQKVWKIFEETVKDFKVIYPAVLKKLKMQPGQPGLTLEAKQKELKAMEELTTSSKTGIDNAKKYTISDWDNPAEVGSILNKLLDKEKE